MTQAHVAVGHSDFVGLCSCESPQGEWLQAQMDPEAQRMVCLSPSSLDSLLAFASASDLGKPWPCGGFQQPSHPAGFPVVSGPIQRGLQVVRSGLSSGP